MEAAPTDRLDEPYALCVVRGVSRQVLVSGPVHPVLPDVFRAFMPLWLAIAFPGLSGGDGMCAGGAPPPSIGAVVGAPVPVVPSPRAL